MIIVTVSTQRSGTKFLGSLFSTGNQVATFGEMFNPDNDGPLGFRGYLQGRTLQEICAAGSDGIVDTFLSHFATVRGIVHFDLMFNQLEFCCTSWNGFYGPFMYGYLRSRSALVIILKRDPLEAFKSLKRLQAFGIPHALEATRADNRPTVSSELVLRKADALAYKAWLEQQYATAERSFEGYEFLCPVTYEEVAETGELPDSLKDMIVAVAKFNNLDCNRDLIQAGNSVFKRSSADPLTSITWI